MKAQIVRTVSYHSYIKIKGSWFDRKFPAKDCEHNSDCSALTLAEAKTLVGKTGNLWKITTIAEPIVQNT